MLGRIYRVYLKKQNQEEKQEIIELTSLEEFEELNPFYIENWEYLPCYYFDSQKYVAFENPEQLEIFLEELNLHEEHQLSGLEAVFKTTLNPDKTFQYGENQVIFTSEDEILDFKKLYEMSEEEYLLQRKMK